MVPRVEVADEDGTARPGDPVAWDESRGAWCSVKDAADVTDAERAQHRNRPVPGEPLDPQPPQETAVLDASVVRAGVTAKANRMRAQGGVGLAREYLESRVAVGMIDRATAVEIGAGVGVKIAEVD